MRCVTPTWRLVGIVLASLLFTVETSSAGKPGKPGGGGGGGGENPAYSIIPFTPPGVASVSSYVSDVNDQGQAVGSAESSAGVFQAVHLDVLTGVYTPLADGSSAQGVNNLNQTVGAIQDGGPSLAAFWSSPSADPTPLSPLAGDVASSALAVNDDGIVVGWSEDEASVFRGAVWRVVVDGDGIVHVDGPVELPDLNVSTITAGRDVSAVIAGAAQVVGDSDGLAVAWTVGLNPDGTLAAPSAPVSVGTLGAAWSEGAGTNNYGDTCGRSNTADSETFGLPFVASAGQDPLPLPVPRGTVYGIAEDISDDGAVVGTVRVVERRSSGYGVEHAYLWNGGNAIDLNGEIPSGSGWNLKWATVISNNGLIGGWGTFDGSTCGYLLIPGP